jgi:osmoprotectant transport system permease protein
MQAEFMYPALADGQVDVIAGYSSDGQIAKYGLVTLDDPKQAIPPYDAVLLVSPRRAGDDKFRAALQPLIGAISIEMMREANLKASAGGADGSPAEVAKWLSSRLSSPGLSR